MRLNQQSDKVSPLNWRPCLEVLDDRTCPSVASGFSGGTLWINGDGASDSVQVSMNGNQVSVTANGQTQSFVGVQAINVNLGAGNDTLAMNGSVAGVNMNLAVNMGDGNDFLNGNISGTGQATSFRMTLDGGGGVDGIRLIGPMAGPTVQIVNFENWYR